MKEIYIILTYTGTVLSKLIRIATKDEFSHVSISLDQNLSEMYSFGRINPYNPFFGGFVHESPLNGTFKRFEKTTYSKIYTLKVNDEQYKILQERLNKMWMNNKIYKFNILGLIGAKFRYKVTRKNSYYCAEFIKQLMDEALINNNLPQVAKPDDFKNIKDINLCYCGMLKDYDLN